ncbi:MAG: histidine phosphatase family protein [Caulobacterales bacterium]|nr:histidine phosphatase family protein [Caulobacterales bacterium]
MDRLILLRHGKAEAESDSGDDFDRRLAPRGERESAEMGARLAEMGFQPDVVLLSPSARTRGTWAAACAAFPKAAVQLEDHLYNADTGAIWQAIEAAGQDAATVMVVGHNPGLQELTLSLLIEGSAPAGLLAKAQRHFPPAAASVFLFDGSRRPHYDGLFYPERGD